MKPPARKAQKIGGAESQVDPAAPTDKALPSTAVRVARAGARGPAKAQDGAPETATTTTGKGRGAAPNSARRKRRPSALAATDDDMDSSAADSPATLTNANHNKYCHFCQHVKVKRASSMISCDNKGCNRRFCEYCLNTHVRDAQREDGQPWHCPICRKSCCCTMRECTQNHRHCKAYRYRRKRAAQADVDVSGSSVASNGMFLVAVHEQGHAVRR
uniref:RING-type domain-containing protein n=1 Tax=Hemiselmis tepida TaxID=464990 RepID=A0A7S0W794_9CRYP|mmetsp:Transcript_31249/g.79274  ORF Transcript_31249/g.79274 Transcript_31249/m.79274 type:complete len:216 (+) Transcript_31249:333-980(+)